MKFREKVYVVLEDVDWDNWEICGIYTTKEKALMRKQELKDEGSKEENLMVDDWILE